ncbi:MAG: polysaccharide deacetylase family protein [Cyclobacteriaceae bacterium]|nr:polysaccharide deacetylase family protein [Cyclobacteriaceae bacterium]
MYFFKTPEIIKWYYPSLVWNGPRDEKSIFLTFDDGPVAGVTGNILQTLAKFNVKATFFCVGENIDRNPGLFRQVFQEGHMIGNHTFHHLNGWQHTGEDYIQDIRKCAAVIEGNGFSPGIKLFRPPYGKIRKSAIQRIIKEYQIIMWDVLTYDFSGLSREKLLRQSKRHTTGGSIIVFHDSLKTRSNTEFLISQFIDHFISLDYNFCTLDRLFLLN